MSRFSSQNLGAVDWSLSLIYLRLKRKLSSTKFNRKDLECLQITLEQNVWNVEQFVYRERHL